MLDDERLLGNHEHAEQRAVGSDIVCEINEERIVLKPLELSQVIVIRSSPSVRRNERKLVHPVEDLRGSQNLRVSRP